MQKDTKELAQKVALLYYDDNKNQNEISQQLGISRSYVAKLLGIAREQKVVEISINIDENQNRLLRREVEFEKKFPLLKQAYILKSDNSLDTLNRIGNFAGPIIADLIEGAKTIGVNLGVSVDRAVSYIDGDMIHGASEKKVIQIMGGLNNNTLQSVMHPNELIRELSGKLGCKSYYLNCPAIIDNKELRAGLLKEQSISSVVAYWDNLDLAIMGIGVVDETSKLYTQLSPNMKKELDKFDATGELTLNFLDSQGNYIPLFEDNKMSIGFLQLKKVKSKVVICAGGNKSKTLVSALKGGMIDILITDSLTIDATEELV